MTVEDSTARTPDPSARASQPSPLVVGGVEIGYGGIMIMAIVGVFIWPVMGLAAVAALLLIAHRLDAIARQLTGSRTGSPRDEPTSTG